MSHAAVPQSRATGAVCDQQSVLRPSNLLVVGCKRLHKLYRIDALLKANAPQVVERQSCQGHNRRSIERSVVEPIHQMDSSRAGCSDTNSEPPGVFGETRSHECRSFFVTNWYVANLIAALTQRFNDRVDAVANDSKSVGCAPINQRFDNNVGSIQ